MVIIVQAGFQIGVLPEGRVQLRTRTAAVPLSLSRRLCCSWAPAWPGWASGGGRGGVELCMNANSKKLCLRLSDAGRVGMLRRSGWLSLIAVIAVVGFLAALPVPQAEAIPISF